MTETDMPGHYPLIGRDPDLRVPPRSVLASLKPMGLGTPYRESLSSYYLSLAYVHRVSPRILARELIIPRDGEHRESGGDDVHTAWKQPLFNGIGTVPEIWAARLSELTGQHGLIDLTLVPLRPYTHRQLLMSAKKNWCPLCLSEAEAEGRTYGQLLWEIAAVEACPKHGIRLVNQCSCHGSASRQAGGKIHLPGICSSCGRSLAHSTAAELQQASENEILRAELVAELLRDMDKLKGGGSGISDFLSHAIRHFANGNEALFGRMLGIRKNTLHGWLHSDFTPRLPQVVEIALSCRCSIADVMSGATIAFKGTEIVHAQPKTIKTLRRQGIGSLDRDNVIRQLKDLLLASPPVSVSAAANQVRLNRRTLSAEFSDITDIISQRFKEYRSAEKVRKFSERCDTYRQSAANLVDSGIMPTPRLVGLESWGRRVIIKDQEKTACSAICEEEVLKRRTG